MFSGRSPSPVHRIMEGLLWLGSYGILLGTGGLIEGKSPGKEGCPSFPEPLISSLSSHRLLSLPGIYPSLSSHFPMLQVQHKCPSSETSRLLWAHTPAGQACSRNCWASASALSLAPTSAPAPVSPDVTWRKGCLWHGGEGQHHAGASLRSGPVVSAQTPPGLVSFCPSVTGAFTSGP